MARYRQNQRSSTRRSTSRGYGKDRAIQHIREAEELSRQLGGTDKDVKAYFFSLTPIQLSPILEEYGRLYGEAARAYARETIPLWRSGTTKMSGLVAGRLFALLPNFMDRSRKFSLVKSLWEHCCPSSNYRLYVGSDASLHEIANLVRRHFELMISDYRISDKIVARFDWLAGADVKLRQELYNYYQQLEKDLLADGLENRLPMFLAQISPSGAAESLTQTIRIGNHQVEIQFSRRFKGVSETPVVEQNPLQAIGCFIIAAIVVVALFILIKSSG